MADFQEVADSLRALLEEARNNPLEILDPSTVEFSKRIAVQTAHQSESQRNIANELGQQFVVSKQLGFLARKRVLDAKMLTGLSSEVEDRVRAELAMIDEIVSQNDELLRSIHEQASAHGELIGDTVELNVHEERHVEIVAEIAAIKFEMSTMDKAALKNAKTHIANLEDEAKSRKTMSLQEKRDSKVAVLRNKQHEVFGFTQESINEKVDEMGILLGTTAGTIALIATALKVVLGPVVDHMTKLRDLGLTWTQTIEASQDTFSAMMDRGFVRGLMTMKSTAEVVLAMRGNFADITFQSTELVTLGGELVTSFKLTADEAATLLETFTKVGGLSAESQENVLRMALAFGQINKIRPEALLQAVAKHASVFARFGEKGAQAFFRSVTAAERLGIELDSIESTADSFLDIDSFFQDVSKLRTLGIDIADPFGLAQIAQSGTPEELLNELQRQMQGIDLTSMGRIQRNALAQAMGMSVGDLSRLIEGPGAGGIETVTGAQVDELGQFADGMGGAVDAMREMVSGLGGIEGSLRIIIGLMVLNQLGGGKILGALGKVLGLGRGAAVGAQLALPGFGGAATGAGLGTGALAGGAALLGTGALLAGAGAAAFLATDAVLGGNFEKMDRTAAFRQRARSSEAHGMAFDARREATQARMRERGVISPAMMDEMSRAVRSGVEGAHLSTFVDGRNMTAQLQRSQGSANN